jgi:hypothetical protein
MKLQEVKEVLFAELNDLLSNKGFNLIASRDIFLKKTNDGFQEIYFDVLSQFMQVSIDISMRSPQAMN